MDTDAHADDGDGVGAVHVKTMAGLWALWRRGWRLPRGLAHTNLRLSLGCFESVPQASKRGQALRHALMELLGTEDPGIQPEPQELLEPCLR